MLTLFSSKGFLNRLAAVGNVFKCFLPFDSTGQIVQGACRGSCVESPPLPSPHETNSSDLSFVPGILAPIAVEPAAEGHRLTDEHTVPLDDEDLDLRRALLAGAAAKRSGS